MTMIIMTMMMIIVIILHYKPTTLSLIWS